MNDPERERFDASDLVPVTDTTPVEHIGGPNDGEFLPCLNGLRPGGMYVPVNELTQVGARWCWATVAMRFVRHDNGEDGG